MQIAVAPPDVNGWSALLLLLLLLLQRSFAYMATRIDPPSSLDGMGLAESRSKAVHDTLIIATDHAGLAGTANAGRTGREPPDLSCARLCHCGTDGAAWLPATYQRPTSITLRKPVLT